MGRHPILRLRKRLSASPSLLTTADVRLRTFEASPADLAAWLSLRNIAFAGLVTAGRIWREADFRRELMAKPWWNPRTLWFAESHAQGVVGTVAVEIAERREAAAVVHWLMVAPACRRRGIASALVSQAEFCGWQAGAREIEVETLASWPAAVAFYTRHGYVEFR